MPDFDNEIVRVEIRKLPEGLSSAFDEPAGKKARRVKSPEAPTEVLCGYNAAGQLVTSISGGKEMKLMTASGWQDGREDARLAEEIRLLRQAIAPSGRTPKNKENKILLSR